MDNANASGGDLKFTFLLVLAMVAMGVSSGLRVQPTSPPAPERAKLTALPSDVQNLPARLWQDPIKATETARRNPPASNPSGGSVAGGTCLLKLVEARLQNPEDRIILLFVSLPSDPHPEASEQRIRTRVAVVSALSTAGYRPVSSSRLGLAVWNANDDRIATQTTPITTQTALIRTRRSVWILSVVLLNPTEMSSESLSKSCALPGGKLSQSGVPI